MKRASLGQLENKVAIITGGCSGLGKAATELFLKEGAKVVAVCLRAKGEALEKAHPGKLAFLQADVRETAAMEKAVALAEERFGGLDIFYHNAGASGTPTRLEDMTETAWDDGMALLLRSSAFAIKHAVPAMKRRNGGTILLTSSVGATNISHSADFGLPVYSVAKNAAITLGRLAALELAKYRIRVNTLVPGGFPTSIFGSMSGASPEIADRMGRYMIDAFAQFQPLPRAGDPRDIANAALFLASDAAAFITGTELFVDGGLQHSWPNSASYLQDAMIAAKARAEGESA